MRQIYKTDRSVTIEKQKNRIFRQRELFESGQCSAGRDISNEKVIGKVNNKLLATGNGAFSVQEGKSHHAAFVKGGFAIPFGHCLSRTGPLLQGSGPVLGNSQVFDLTGRTENDARRPFQEQPQALLFDRRIIR